MQQDRLQIALEHHRAGRVRQAEAGYRAVLADNPADADALHWLGVLLTQAGRAVDAIPLLQRAIDAVPEDAAWQHNLGQALLMVGRVEEAIVALTESAALEPARGDTFLALARAYAIRRSPSDAAAAVAALRRAHEQGVDTPELHHDLGVALLAAGSVHEAIASLATAIDRRPDYAPPLFQMAMAHRKRGDVKAVRNWLNKALEVNRGYAQAWHALAAIDANAGHFDLAIGHYRRAIKHRPGWQTPMRSLENLLRRIGRTVEADEVARELASVEAETSAAATVADGHISSTPAPEVAELEARLTFDSTRARLHEALSAMSGLLTPSRSTPEAMTKLFDGYADRFESHLRDKLHYAGPEQLADAIARVRTDDRLLDVADVGCGTGLCGPLLRPMARSLVGIDLSPRMLDKARQRNLYDRLEQGDMLELLTGSADSFDLVVAADVLIYVGDLTPFFEAVTKALRPGGLLAVSVELAEGERYVRNHRTRRFAHSQSYLERLGKIFGLDQRLMEPVTLREEIHKPVAALIAVFSRPAER